MPHRCAARRLLRRPAAVLGLVVLVLPVAGPVSAHETLVSSDPADAAALTVAPTQVTLTFSAEQLAVGTAVAVTGPDGAAWADGAPRVVGAVVTQPLLPGLPDGGFTVQWRSVAGDGHPVEGTLTFSLSTAPAPVAAPTATPAPGPTPSARPTGDPSGTTSPTAGPAASEPAGRPSDRSGPSPWLLAAPALVAAVLAVPVARRRGSR